MSGFDKEMQDALRADAEKLRAMGVDVADPIFLETGPQERGHGATTGSHHNTRPAEGSPEELIWLRGYEAGVIDMRADAKASGQLDTIYQDAHRASVRSTIATSMKREEALNLMKLGFDEVVRHKDDQLEALRAENAELKAVARDVVDLITEAFAEHKAEKIAVAQDRLRSALSPQERDDE